MEQQHNEFTTLRKAQNDFVLRKRSYITDKPSFALLDRPSFSPKLPRIKILPFLSMNKYQLRKLFFFLISENTEWELRP
jgi:hypothetical protein